MIKIGDRVKMTLQHSDGSFRDHFGNVTDEYQPHVENQIVVKLDELLEGMDGSLHQIVEFSIEDITLVT